MRFPSFLRRCAKKNGEGLLDVMPLHSNTMVHERMAKTRKRRNSRRENAKNAENSTFSTIKVRNTSLLFAKVVILYKVRNFAERFACALQYSRDFRLKLKF